MSDDIDELEDALDAGEDENPSGARKTLSSTEWEEVKSLWEIGDVSLAELSDRYGIRADTIQKRLKKHGVVKGSKAAIAGAMVESEAQSTAAVNAKRIRETKEQHYQYAEALGKLTMQEILNAKRENKAFGMVDPNINALGKAAKTLSIIRKERWQILGLDKDEGDPDEMPELLISELTDEQIGAMQAELRGESSMADGLEDLDTTISDSVIEGED